jgi:glycosyltransferase involved in cell wall biosynthesis
MLKIAMIAGPIAYTVALSNALSRYCRIDLYCGKRYAGQEDPSVFSGLAGNVTLILYEEYRKRDPRNAVAQYKLCRMLRKGNYDLIHLQFEWEWAMLLLYPMIRKIPLVFTVHDPYQHPGNRRFFIMYMDLLQAFFIRKAKRLVVHGDVMRRQLLQRYPRVRPEEVLSHLIGDSSLQSRMDSNASAESDPSPDNIILFFGNVRPNKGVPYLVKAEPLLAAKLDNFRIHIVGRCADDSYKKLIVDRSRYVLSEQFLPHDKVAEVFSAATVVVLPYLDATQTAVIPLAYGYGRPVVASAVGGIVDMVEDGKTGILVEPRNERALADALCTILTDKALAGRMGRNAREFAKTRLSWESSAAATANLYQSVVAEAPGGR